MAKKEFDLSQYLDKEQEVLPQVEYKEDLFMIMPESVQQAMKMPGFPLGHMSMIYGLSDSGKTALLLAAVKACQQQDILPILVVTENKLTKDRIVQAGIDLKKLILIENKKCLEDVYDYISGKVQEIIDGKLPVKVMVFWDSVAGAPSRDSFEIKSNGAIEKNFDNRKNANVIGFYNSIIADRIAETRKKDYAGILGLVMITQAYLGEKPKFPPGLPAPVVPNGGEKIWFPLSVAIEVREGSRISATINTHKVDCGLVSRIRVKKNHLSAINSTDGEIAFIGQDVVENDKDIIKKVIEEKREILAKGLL